MPALRLKTKLVIAITAMVVAIVATLPPPYISEVVRQRIQEVYATADAITLHIFAIARPALSVDLSSSRIDLNNPKKVEEAIQDLLQSDTSMSALLESVTGDSPNILDACIVDADGLALLHTNPALQGTIVSPREDFSHVLNGGICPQEERVLLPPPPDHAALPRGPTPTHNTLAD